MIDRKIGAPTPNPEDVETWNRWRLENRGEPSTVPGHFRAGIDLSGINFSHVNLRGMLFDEICLRRACFDSADLEGATFVRCILDQATFHGTRLSGISIRRCSLEGSRFRACDMSNASISFSRMIDSQLSELRMRGADLEQSNLTGCSLTSVDLLGARLRGTGLIASKISLSYLVDATATGVDLSETHITMSTFENTDFSESSFHKSKLVRCHMENCIVIGADFSGAQLHGCVLHDIDLSRTLSDDGMNITHDHGRGADAAIAQLGPSATKRFRSCFLSYSRSDTEFVDQLNRDLAELGVVTWLDRKEMSSTSWIETSLQKAIRSHDALVLVLSGHSEGRDWVKYEVELARAGGVAIIPIVVDYKIGNRQWVADIQGENAAVDFTRWRNEASYIDGRTNLLRRLDAESDI